MCHGSLLQAHREVNKLLGKLALGMGQAELNKRVVSLSETWFGQRRASILRLGSNKQQLYLEYAPNLPDFYNQAIEGVHIGPEVGSCGAAAYLKESVVVEDINTHPNWAPFTELTQQSNLHACWSVPILSSKDSVMGTFAIYSSEPSSPTPNELEVLEMLAALYAVAWEKYQLEHQLHYYASFDSLTGCLNRRALLHRASDALNADHTYIACFFADIDKFKQINDRYGHEVGDKVLASVGHAFKQVFHQPGLCGRYGGDEFVAFAFSEDEIQLEQLKSQVEQALALLAPVEGLNIRVSIGSSVRKLSELCSLQRLIQLADHQMYQVKHANRR
ncbi:sensor domain-containing diguanylate cyclase [Vibrio sinaloensis]|uniref:sensor domain-containing diguanylate cyclase n=1 Tax=Photobacterium sp. (strain ATCC 43367) TaxID=379097 RepID=UPI0035E6BC03